MTAPEALAKIQQACADLPLAREPLTVTTVASAAGISRITLFRDPTLPMVLEEHRTHWHNPRTIPGLVSEIGHLRTAEALTEQVRHHEKQLRLLDPNRHQTRRAK